MLLITWLNSALATEIEVQGAKQTTVILNTCSFYFPFKFVNKELGNTEKLA